MIAKLPILGFALVTAVAGQALAHENHRDGAAAPTYRGPPPAPSYSPPVAYRADRDHGRDYEGYRADLNDMRQYDSDRDGRVTLGEALRQGRREFRRSDRDHNWLLTRHEVTRRDIAEDDRNRNGRISYEEYQNSIRRNFARFDTNRDGVLARYELGRPSGSRPAGWRR